MCRWKSPLCLLIAVGGLPFYAGCRTYYCPTAPAECFSAESGEPTVIKFMTYNIRKFKNEQHWDSRQGELFQTIRQVNPDVLAIQEMRTPQEVDFERAFTDYRQISISNEDPHGDRFQNAIFVRKEAFRVLDYNRFWFSATPEVPSNQWHNKISRVCLWSRIEDLRTGQTFYFYNVHLDHRNGNARLKSISLLANRIRLREHADPYIVAGDFNVNSSNTVIRCMQAGPRFGPAGCRSIRLMDSFEAIRFDKQTHDTFDKLPKSLFLGRIDYIFVPSYAKVLDGQIIPAAEASDHYPVTATIGLPPGALTRMQANAAQNRTASSPGMLASSP